MAFNLDQPIAGASISQTILSLKDNNFHGQFQIYSSQDLTWELYFYLGRIVWISGGIEIAKNWHRDLNRFFSDLDEQHFTPLFNTSSQGDRYLLLLDYLNQKFLQITQIKKFLQNKIIEVFFDIFQHEVYHSLEYKQVPDCSNSQEISSILSQPLALINLEEYLTKSQATWDSWLKAGLGMYSPHLLIKKKSNSPDLSNLSPELLSLLNGNNSLRDLSLLMDSNLVELSTFLLKYVHQGCFQLIEPLRQNYSAHHQFNPAHTLETFETHLSEDESLPLIAAIHGHPQISQSLAKIVQQVGSRLIEIDRSWEAIPKLVSYQPNLIFLSGNLPGISGSEILSQLERVPHLKNIPVIYLANNLWDRFRSQSFSNVRANISETATPNLIFKIVEKLLSQPDRTSASHFLTKYRGIPYIKTSNKNPQSISRSAYENKNLQFRGAYYQATLCIQKYRIVRRLQDKINSFKQKSESVDYQLVGSQSENNNICKNE
ncbi:MAG: hypothetical protein QNJ38_16625 [Prochloraceae cyanobacterium]|nr:hypothetical protein [Prochloraceae cyanobacterium]